MPTYEMTTINSGTRIRKDRNTFAEVITSVPSNTVVKGTEVWTAPADGAEVKRGDKWVKVTYGMFTGWMAYIHKGLFVCNNFKEIADVPPPVDPLPETIFPESFILTDPKTGNKAEYHFVRFVDA